MIQILSWALGLSMLVNLAGIPLVGWWKHREGVEDGRAEYKAEIETAAAKEAAKVETANALEAPKQDELARIINDAVASRPERTRVIERLVESHPEFGAIERPADLHAARVERLNAISEAAK